MMLPLLRKITLPTSSRSDAKLPVSLLEGDERYGKTHNRGVCVGEPGRWGDGLSPQIGSLEEGSPEQPSGGGDTARLPAEEGSGQRSSTCKGPGAGPCRAHWRSCGEGSGAGAAVGAGRGGHVGSTWGSCHTFLWALPSYPFLSDNPLQPCICSLYFPLLSKTGLSRANPSMVWSHCSSWG